MLPDFIIIGAAKAGTTALYWYLAEHPEVFMSAVKETNYFAYGVDENGRLTYGNPELHHFPIKSLDEYKSLFANAAGASAIGEASPIYLECPDSASRIRATIPEARIICGLRDPVSRAYSDYLMYLRNHGLRFDADRDLSEDAAWAQPDSHWMCASRYHEPLRRYYDAFPRERIHVFLFDELKRDALHVAQSVFRFIGVDAQFRPDLATPYNTGGVPSNMLLERLFTAGAAMRTAIEPRLPKRAMKWLRRVRAANMDRAPALPAELRARLLEHFREDILRTAEMTGLNLEAWLDVPAEKAMPRPTVRPVRLGGGPRA